MWTSFINKKINSDLREFFNLNLPKINDTVFLRYLRLGKIIVNDVVVNSNIKIKLNDVIKVEAKEEYLSTKHNLNFLKVSSNIKIIYEDDNIIVVFKPKRVYSQANEHEKYDTLENRIRKYLYDKGVYKTGANNFYIPCLSQRLDYNTSGLVVVGKNINAIREINQMINNHDIKKFYLAKVKPGSMKKAGTITNYLKRENKVSQIEFKKTKTNQLAVTKYKVLEVRSDYNLVELELVTGRTHQLRAHMNYIGHPLLGESKYSSDYKNKKYDSQCLMAYKIIFTFRHNYGDLNYLNNKIIKIDVNKFNF